MPDRVRGICCARRLPPNFGGPRSIMDISIFHILRSSVSLERASRKRERKRGSEGDRRKLEWFSNRFPFQVRTPTTTRRQGLSNSQPPGLSFRKLSFQMFANRLWTRATATFIPVYLSLRRIEIDRARSPIVFNRNSPIDRLSFFQKEFSYTLHSEMILFILDKSRQEFKYFPKIEHETWIEIRSTRRKHRYLLSYHTLILLKLSPLLYLYQNTLTESILLQDRFEFVQHPSHPFQAAEKPEMKNQGGSKNPHRHLNNSKVLRWSWKLARFSSFRSDAPICWKGKGGGGQKPQ